MWSHPKRFANKSLFEWLTRRQDHLQKIVLLAWRSLLNGSAELTLRWQCKFAHKGSLPLNVHSLKSFWRILKNKSSHSLKPRSDFRMTLSASVKGKFRGMKVRLLLKNRFAFMAGWCMEITSEIIRTFQHALSDRSSRTSHAVSNHLLFRKCCEKFAAWPLCHHHSDLIWSVLRYKHQHLLLSACRMGQGWGNFIEDYVNHSSVLQTVAGPK